MTIIDGLELLLKAFCIFMAFGVLCRIWQFISFLREIAIHLSIRIGSLFGGAQGDVAFTYDGDTIRAGDRRIRIAYMDAPEHGQIALDGTTKAGDAATRIMRQLAPNGCKAVISPIATDVYGRIVAKVTIGNVDVGLEMIRRGFAIALDDAPAAYVRAEKRARRERIGLWAVGGFLEPKQFRRTNPWEGPSA